MMRPRTLLQCTALLAVSASSIGCMSFDDATSNVTLATHVTDWREEIIYQVLIDRFADADQGNNYRVDPNAPGRWHGGDWAGLESKLDYVQDLGVTTIWISPVVKNVDTDAGFDGYHGYWAQDLTAVNPHFGDLPALQSMVRAAHDRGMKVILDIVTNHLGQLFYYDINENGQPDDDVNGGGTSPASPVVHVNEYDPDYDSRGVQASTSLGESGPAPIIFTYDPATNHMPPLPQIFQDPTKYNRKGRTLDFDVPDELLHGDFPGGLKDVKTSDCEVKRAMVDSYARWVELTDLDGFRIDTVKHVEREFWRYFSQRIRQRLAALGKTNFFMFGEAFDGRDELVGSFTMNDAPAPVDLARENECATADGPPVTGDQLDSVFYFPQYFTAIRDVFQQSLPTQEIQDLWAERPMHYGTMPQAGGIGVAPTSALVNFLDNHDVPRFLYSGRDAAALRNAFLFIFTEDGIPCVYYGDEQELAGGNDPANREDLWSTSYDESGATFQWVAKLTRLRRSYPALMKGGQRVVWSTTRTGAEPDAGILAFERGDPKGQYSLIVINSNPAHPSSPVYNGAPMQVSVAPGTALVDVLNPGRKMYTVDPMGGVTIEVAATSGAVLVPADQVAP